MSSRRRSDYKPSGYRARTMQAIRNQRSAQAAAAAMIRRNPTLRGYARSGGSYSGKYKYGGKSAELKFFDNAISFNFDSTGEVPATGQLCTIAQGVAQTQRVGRKITIKKIVAKLTITLATPTDAIGSDILRLALVQDTQTNGAAATFSGVGGVFETDQVNALRNIDNTSRFRVLKDFRLQMNPTAGVSGAWVAVKKTCDFNINCNIPIIYDGSATTGAIDTIRSNNLFLVARGGATDDLYTCVGNIRLRFLDS